MFCGFMGFFTRVSDPVMGGTYMTLMNTLANLGGKWPATMALAFIEPLTTKTCSIGGTPCDDTMWLEECTAKQVETWLCTMSIQ
jgi:PAT family acetyl-CoA transporter-like MFS transporter 1